MSTLREFARARLSAVQRPTWLDLGSAALLAYIGSWSTPIGEQDEQARFIGSATEAGHLYLAVLVVCTLSVAARRVLPTAAVVTLGLAGAIHVTALGSLSLLLAGSGLVAVETCTSRLTSPWSWGLLGAGYLGAGVEVLWVGYLGEDDSIDAARALTLVGMTWTVMTVAALTGLLRRRARERAQQTAEHAQVLMAQQQAEHRLALATERQRIARDVHDLLGHSLSVIGMQAEGARAVLSTDPESAEAALAVIGSTARSSVDEVRALVDVLAPSVVSPPSAPALGVQDPDGTRAAEPPAVGDLPSLIASSRGSGLVITSVIETDQEVPGLLSTIAYRLVQEALTNVIRHAEAAPASVHVRGHDGRLDLEVVNEPAATCRPGQRQGSGIRAMRERVAAVGGSLEAGPTSEGGWRVQATLPYDVVVAVP